MYAGTKLITCYVCSLEQFRAFQRHNFSADGARGQTLNNGADRFSGSNAADQTGHFRVIAVQAGVDDSLFDLFNSVALERALGQAFQRYADSVVDFQQFVLQNGGVRSFLFVFVDVFPFVFQSPVVGLRLAVLSPEVEGFVFRFCVQIPETASLALTPIIVAFLSQRTQFGGHFQEVVLLEQVLPERRHFFALLPKRALDLIFELGSTGAVEFVAFLIEQRVPLVIQAVVLVVSGVVGVGGGGVAETAQTDGSSGGSFNGASLTIEVDGDATVQQVDLDFGSFTVYFDWDVVQIFLDVLNQFVDRVITAVDEDSQVVVLRQRGDQDLVVFGQDFHFLQVGAFGQFAQQDGASLLFGAVTGQYFEAGGQGQMALNVVKGFQRRKADVAQTFLILRLTGAVKLVAFLIERRVPLVVQIFVLVVFGVVGVGRSAVAETAQTDGSSG